MGVMALCLKKKDEELLLSCRLLTTCTRAGSWSLPWLGARDQDGGACDVPARCGTRRSPGCCAGEGRGRLAGRRYPWQAAGRAASWLRSRRVDATGTPWGTAMRRRRGSGRVEARTRKNGAAGLGTGDFVAERAVVVERSGLT